MTNTTKLALEESLKHLLLKKPLDKITINNLTADCGISRMTFYYHFKDIYDLVEWCCLEDARIALQDKKTSSTWHEGLLQIFDAVMENKPFILNVYRCVGRERIENYLFQLTCDLLMGVVTEKSKDIPITDEQKIFIAVVYGLCGKISQLRILPSDIRKSSAQTFPEQTGNPLLSPLWMTVLSLISPISASVTHVPARLLPVVS